MAILEQVFFWFAVFCYIAAAIQHAYRFVFRRGNNGLWEHLFLNAGFAANIATIIVRVIRSGHLPVTIKYESNILIAAAIILVFLIWRRRNAAVAAVGMVCIPVAVLILCGGYVYSLEIQPLTPDFFSRWAALHLVFSVLAAICLVFATGLSIFFLIKSRYPVGQEPPRLASLPPLEEMSHLTYRLVLFGFICWTVMLITGMFWAKDFWGNYWSWDPVETWSLVSWLIWGVYIHLCLTYGLKKKKLAWLCIIGFLVTVISIWGIDLISPESLHNIRQMRTL